MDWGRGRASNGLGKAGKEWMEARMDWRRGRASNGLGKREDQ